MQTPPPPEAAVSVVVKATVQDADYLGVLIPHMIRQGRFPFRERVVVVDPIERFSGKYARRLSRPREQLNTVLKQLLVRGEIDSVVEVDYDYEVRRGVYGRYFGHVDPLPPTHASSGGPIYAALFALEASGTDLVLQMDADMFFHSGHSSWIVEALNHMTANPNLWLMMTHPGPPSGPVGSSLAEPNRSRARWDTERRIWRFKTCSLRYFLADRRKLYGNVIPLIAEGGGCAPVEQCISEGMRVAGAERGCLGSLESWHLHGWSHEPPFAAWAPAVALAVEAGDVPVSQRGNYNLRLDRESERAKWRDHLLSGGYLDAAAA